MRRQIRACHRAHGDHDGHEQHGIGLGIEAFNPEQDAARQHQGGEHGGPPRHQGERRPVGQENSPDRTGERRHAVEPDRGERVPIAERARGLHHARLQPVDADRFLVARPLLETDVDVVAALHHLLGRLRESGFVAIDGRNPEQPGKEAQQCNHHQNCDRARVRSDPEIDDSLEAAQARRSTLLALDPDHDVPPVPPPTAGARPRCRWRRRHP